MSAWEQALGDSMVATKIQQQGFRAHGGMDHSDRIKQLKKENDKLKYLNLETEVDI